MERLPLKVKDSMQHMGQELPELAMKWFSEEVVGRSPHTLYARKVDLSKFFLFYKNLNGHLYAASMMPRDVKLFLNELESSGYKHTSINRHLGSIRAFSSWLLKTGVTRTHACKGIKEFHVQLGPPKAPRDKEFHRLRKAADALAGAARYRYSQDQRNLVLLETLNASGLRISELLSARLHQLRGKKLVDIKCKGGKVRSVSIKGAIAKMIEEYVGHHRVPGSNFIFTSKSGEQLDRVSAWKALKTVARYASVGLPDAEKVELSPHMLRHRHGFQCRKAKDPVFAAARLGHANLSYIDRYTGETTEEEQHILEALD